MPERTPDPADREPDPEAASDPDASAESGRPSSILSSDPVLGGDPGVSAPGDAGSEDGPHPRPEVAWGPPPRPSGVPVDGRQDLVYGSLGARLLAWFIDNLLLGVLSMVLSIGLSAAMGLDTPADPRTVGILYWVVFVAASALYFVLAWTSGSRATVGMRALNLRVDRVGDGGPLAFGQAVVRWALLGYVLFVLVLVPQLAEVASLLWLVWPFVLLVSTAVSPARRGIHDRVSGSTIVRPVGASASGPAIACAVALVIVALFIVVSTVGLLLAGEETLRRLEEIGRSV